jgi:hypothetical protein
VAHVAVGVDRLDVHAHQGVAAPAPAQLLRRAVEPELGRLGYDRVRPVEHRVVSAVDGAQLPADLLLYRRRHGKDGDVEVFAGQEGGPLLN